MHTSAVSRLARCSSASRTVSVSRRTGGRSDRTASRTTRPSSDGSAIARSATPASTWSTRTAPVTATNRSAATSATVDDGEASCMATDVGQRAFLVRLQSSRGDQRRHAGSGIQDPSRRRPLQAAVAEGNGCLDGRPWVRRLHQCATERGDVTRQADVVEVGRRPGTIQGERRRRHPHRRTPAVVGRATRPSHLRSAQGAATVIGARCEASL